MKRISLLAVVCSLTLIKSSIVAIPMHPAVQAELQKCAAHGWILINVITENLKEAQELKQLGDNALAAKQLASNIAEKTTADAEKTRFFAALKKQQNKVAKPEVFENFVKALGQTVITFLATMSVPAQQNTSDFQQNAKAQQSVMLVNGIPVQASLFQALSNN